MVINRCVCGCVTSNNITYCYSCLNKVFDLIEKGGFKRGSKGLNGYLLKSGLIKPSEYNQNQKVKQDDILNKYVPFLIKKQGEIRK